MSATPTQPDAAPGWSRSVTASSTAGHEQPPEGSPASGGATRQDDAGTARELAEQAGRLLLQVRSANPGVDPAQLKDLGDRSAQDLLAGQLALRRPGDAVLSEEAVDDGRRLTASRVWIIDPLDGTREYSEGRHDWAVHVALWELGALTAAAVALPGLGLVLGTNPPPPAPPARADGQLRMAVSRTRAPALAQELSRRLDLQPVPMGSAGYKVAAVVRGEVDLYVHAGGQYEWDSAAPVAVAVAAGLHASRIDGSALRYNQQDVLLPDLLICRPELADQVLMTIAQVQP
jgi:3'(2'), 5'-bisphosphate nucleotidase